MQLIGFTISLVSKSIDPSDGKIGIVIQVGLVVSAVNSAENVSGTFCATVSVSFGSTVTPRESCDAFSASAGNGDSSASAGRSHGCSS